MAFKRGNIPWNVGIPMSEKTREKLCESLKGREVWNKDLIGEEYKSHYKNGMKGIFKKGHINSKEARDKQSQTTMGHPGYMLGKKQTEETKEKIKKALCGLKRSDEAKLNMSLSRRGEKGAGWIDGRTPLVGQIRKDYKYRQWRSDVFTRDEFTCQECGVRGGYLHSHHIKSFSSILQFHEITTLEQALECEELWNINNGITLCKECHRNIKS